MPLSLFARCFSGDFSSDTSQPKNVVADQIGAKAKLETKWIALEPTSSDASNRIGIDVLPRSRPDSRATDVSLASTYSGDTSESSSLKDDVAQTSPANSNRSKGISCLGQLTPNNFLGLQQYPPRSHIPSTVESLTKPTPFAESAAAAASNDAETLYGYALQHGRRIMAISTLQEGLAHFSVPDVGYIAYTMMYNGPAVLNIKTAVALSDPVCASDQYAHMAEAFMQQNPGAMFVQISKQFATVLSSLGLKINAFAGETHLDLQKYTFSGYAKRGLRSAISSAVKEGYTVHEVMQAPQDGNPAAAAATSTAVSWSGQAREMQEVDDSWVHAKGAHAADVWFLNRPPVMAPERGVRKFTARDAGGRLQAFVFFDAVYEGGKAVGYYANVTRMRPEAHPGVLNLLVSHFIDRIRAECQLSAPAKKVSIKKSQLKKQQAAAAAGANDTLPVADTTTTTTTTCSSSSSVPTFLSLGMSPFHARDDSEFKHSPVMSFLLGFMYKQGTGFYPAKTVAAAKAKYGAGLHDGRYDDPNVTYEQVYLAHDLPDNPLLWIVPAQKMFDFLRLIGIWDNHIEAGVRYLHYQAKRSARIVRKKVVKVVEKRRRRKDPKKKVTPAC